MKIEKKKSHQIDRYLMNKGEVSIIPGGDFHVFCLRLMVGGGEYMRIMLGKENVHLVLIKLGIHIDGYANQDYYILEDK